MLNLLAVEFAETDAPAGVVTLIFSGGAMLRLEVECLEAELADLGPPGLADAGRDVRCTVAIATARRSLTPSKPPESDVLVDVRTSACCRIERRNRDTARAIGR